MQIVGIYMPVILGNGASIAQPSWIERFVGRPYCLTPCL